MSKPVSLDVIYEHPESVWGSNWRLCLSKLDDGVQFVIFQYCGVPTNHVWIDAKAIPHNVLQASVY